MGESNKDASRQAIGRGKSTSAIGNKKLKKTLPSYVINDNYVRRLISGVQLHEIYRLPRSCSKYLVYKFNPEQGCFKDPPLTDLLTKENLLHKIYKH